MKARIVVLAAVVLATVLISRPAHLYGRQGPPAPQNQAAMANMAGMMSQMHANDAKLDELVKKMKGAQGAAKTDAVAEVVAALVEERKNAHEPMMANMMSMMNMMSDGMGHAQPAPAAPKK